MLLSTYTEFKSIAAQSHLIVCFFFLHLNNLTSIFTIHFIIICLCAVAVVPLPVPIIHLTLNPGWCPSRVKQAAASLIKIPR